MAWAAIKRDIRSRLGEPTPGFWTDVELEDWYNEGVALQHAAVWQALLTLEDREISEAIENDYARTFMAKSSAIPLVAGTQDYSLPAGFWRAVRVTVTIDGVEVHADFSPFADDWEVRNLPHRAPSRAKPLYTLTPDAKIRFYVSPGIATVPNAAANCYVFFIKLPNTVDLETGGAVDTNVPDPYNAGPKAYACYRASVKQYDDGGPYASEFRSEVQAITPGPSKEAAEKKTVIIREVAAAQQQGA